MPTGQMRRRAAVRLVTLVAAIAVFSLSFANLASGFASGDPPGAKGT